MLRQYKDCFVCKTYEEQTSCKLIEFLGVVLGYFSHVNPHSPLQKSDH